MIFSSHILIEAWSTSSFVCSEPVVCLSQAGRLCPKHRDMSIHEILDARRGKLEAHHGRVSFAAPSESCLTYLGKPMNSMGMESN